VGDSGVKNYPAVRVFWLDSHSQDGWGEYDKPTNLECVSIGHLVHRDESAIVLALNKNSYGMYGSFITIPMCSVKWIGAPGFDEQIWPSQ